MKPTKIIMLSTDTKLGELGKEKDHSYLKERLSVTQKSFRVFSLMEGRTLPKLRSVIPVKLTSHISKKSIFH